MLIFVYLNGEVWFGFVNFWFVFLSVAVVIVCIGEFVGLAIVLVVLACLLITGLYFRVWFCCLFVIAVFKLNLSLRFCFLISV